MRISDLSSDLCSSDLVTLGKGSAILAAVQRAYRSRGRQFESSFVVSGFDTMLALVREGLGVGLIPPGVLGAFRIDSSLETAELQGEWHDRRYLRSPVDTNRQPLPVRERTSVV